MQVLDLNIVRIKVNYMKIKQGFSIKKENGENIIVCDKSIHREFNSIILLSDTSAYLWELLQNEDATKAQMLNGILQKFDVSTVLALSDIDVFIKTLKENGILEE